MNNNIENRNIRVFISSTFDDMKEERDELVSKVFPLLRKIVAKYSVTVTDIDLRWGITEEESQRGNTINICLEEIERSQPFFIGILGSRYGWVPKVDGKLENAIQSQYKWVIGDIQNGMSITEIEMQYAVLRNEAKVRGCFFIKNDDESRIEVSQLRLRNNIIENSPCPVYHYDTVQELADHVIKDFEEYIKELYPLEDVDSLSASRFQQRSYLNSKIQHYIPHPGVEDKLHEFIYVDEKKNLCLLSDSGMGKSTILAKLVLDMTDDPDIDVIAFFSDNTSHDATYDEAASWICTNLSAMYDIDYDTTQSSPADCLKYLAGRIRPKKPLFIVLDGVDQLSFDGKNSDVFSCWPAWPKGVKVIFSAATNTNVAKFIDLNIWSAEYVDSMTIDQRMTLAINYFFSYRKELSDTQKELLGKDYPLLRNTLVFVSLLDELRRYGSHDDLTNFIEIILGIDNIDDFFKYLILRQSDLFGKGGRNVAKEILSLIALSESGLTENQIIEMTKLSRLEFSTFICANSLHLKIRNGKICFSHQLYLKAVSDLFLSDCSYVERQRKCIISHFIDKLDDNDGLIEIPYQCYMLGDYDSLYYNLLKIKIVTGHLSSDRCKRALAVYWTALCEADPYKYDIIEYVYEVEGDMNLGDVVFQDFLKSGYMPLRFQTLFSLLRVLMIYTHLYESCSRLASAMQMVLARLQDCDIMRESAYGYMAAAESHVKNWPKALSYYKILFERYSGKIHDATTSNLGEMFLSMYEDTHNPRFLNYAHNILEQVMKQRLEVYDTQYHPDVAVAYANYAAVLSYFDKEKGEEMSLKSIEIYAALNGKSNVDIALEYLNLALRFQKENPEKALTYVKDALAIYSSFEESNGYNTLDAKMLAGKLCAGLKRYDEALEYLTDLISEIDDLPERCNKVNLLDNYAMVAYHLEMYEVSKGAYENALLRCEESDSTNISRLANLGKIYLNLHDERNSSKYYKKAIELAYSLGDIAKTMINCVFYSGALFSMNKLDAALRVLDEVIVLGDMNDIQDVNSYTFALFNRAMIRFKKGGDSDECINDVERAISIRERIFGPDDAVLAEYKVGLDELKSTIRTSDDSTQSSCPEINEMRLYLNGKNNKALELFGVAFINFRNGIIGPAIYGLSEVVDVLNESEKTAPSAVALALRFLAFANEEAYFKSSKPDKEMSKEDIIDIYQRAVEYSMADANYRLAQMTSHDMGEFYWRLNDYQNAEYCYWNEILCNALMDKLHDYKSICSLINIVSAKRKGYSQMEAQFALSIANFGLVLCEMSEVEEDIICDFTNLKEQAMRIMDLDEDSCLFCHAYDMLILANYLILQKRHEANSLARILLKVPLEYYDENGDVNMYCAVGNAYAFSLFYDNKLSETLNFVSENLFEYFSDDSFNDEALKDNLFKLLIHIYVRVHDMEKARSLCKEAGIPESFAEELHDSILVCTKNLRDGNLKEVEDRVKMLRSYEHDGLYEDECYDLIYYSLYRNEIYEAQKYFKIWRNLTVDSESDDAELYISASNEIIKQLG